MEPHGQTPQFGQHYPESSQATMILILGILGIVVCSICAPIAWVMGNKELEAIDAGRRDPSQRGTANAGRIIGIVGTVIMALAIVIAIVVILIAVAASTSS